MVGYTDNHMRCKLYNHYIKRVIMKRDVRWVERKMISLSKTLKISHGSHEEDLVPGIEEYRITRQNQKTSQKTGFLCT